MADSMDIEIQGIEELEKQMESLIKAVHPDKVEPVLLDGAKVMQKAIKGKIHHSITGNLKKGVKAKVMRRRGGSAAAIGLSAGDAAPALVAMDFRTAPHYHLVEYGHGGPHPAPAYPFFRPGVDASKEQAINQIIEDINNLIDKGLA